MERRLTFAPQNNRYRTGAQIFNADTKPIEVTVDIYLNGDGEKDGEFIKTLKYRLGVRGEALFTLDQVGIDPHPKRNYSLDMKSDGFFHPYCYHVDPADNLLKADVLNPGVPTQGGN